MPDYERMQMYESGTGMFHDHLTESEREREERLYGDESFDDRPLPPLINWSAIWRFFFPKKEGAPQ